MCGIGGIGCSSVANIFIGGDGGKGGSIFGALVSMALVIASFVVAMYFLIDAVIVFPCLLLAF